jgi:AraC family transcriptional regulator
MPHFPISLKINGMIARKLLTPEPQEQHPNPACPTLRFADHTLLTETLARPYHCPEHIPGPGILTLLSGTGRFTLNGENLLLDHTRYLLTDRASRLSIRLPRPDAQPLFLFFRTDTVNEALTKQHADFCWLERTHPMNDGLRDSLSWLVRLGNSCSSFSALKADAMIRDILLDLVREALTAESTAERLAVSRRSTRIELFKRLSLAREWIHANYSYPASLEAMAEKASLNRQHFLRTFRDCFGITPHQYIVDVRLATARQLLAETKEPVTAICRLTGFESLSSFSGLFRRRFGASPTTYRQRVTPSPHSAAPPSGSADPILPPTPISD